MKKMNFFGSPARAGVLKKIPQKIIIEREKIPQKIIIEGEKIPQKIHY